MSPKSELSSLTVGMISLGCAKNLVDAEVMLGSLTQGGHQLIQEAAEADVVIINTCSFIDAAQQESIDSILEAAELRDRRNPNQALVVSGCLSQRFREELPGLLPEVDAFIGIDQVAGISRVVEQAFERRGRRKSDVLPVSRLNRKRVVALPIAPEALPAQVAGPLIDIASRPTYVPDFSTPRLRLTPAHFAYVKIAEGCNHPCSFCTIPRMRGAHRSRPAEDIMLEVQALVKAGVREINLISQDSTYYGMDLLPRQGRSLAGPEEFNLRASSLPVGSVGLPDLLEKLNAVPGDFWIRLLYTHPAHWTDRLIETISRCEKVARYIDIPLQHIDDGMLQRMRRETSRAYIETLIARIRAGIPGVALRTTFIVGFPGETEAAFEVLADFVERTRFERLGVFTYSQESGTLAGRMQDQVDGRVKKRRQNLIMKAQQRIARKISQAQVGRELKVLVEKTVSNRQELPGKISSWEHGLLRGSPREISHGPGWLGRTEADAPDIDGRVYLYGKARPGEFARVRVLAAGDYDLVGQAG